MLQVDQQAEGRDGSVAVAASRGLASACNFVLLAEAAAEEGPASFDKGAALVDHALDAIESVDPKSPLFASVAYNASVIFWRLCYSHLLGGANTEDEILPRLERQARILELADDADVVWRAQVLLAIARLQILGEQNKAAQNTMARVVDLASRSPEPNKGCIYRLHEDSRLCPTLLLQYKGLSELEQLRAQTELNAQAVTTAEAKLREIFELHKASAEGGAALSAAFLWLGSKAICTAQLDIAHRCAALAQQLAVDPLSHIHSKALQLELKAVCSEASTHKELEATFVAFESLLLEARTLKGIPLHTMQHLCCIVWKSTLTFLNDTTRRCVQPALEAVAATLERIGSPMAELRCCVHIELARCTREAGLLASFAAHLSTAKCLASTDISVETIQHLEEQLLITVAAQTNQVDHMSPSQKAHVLLCQAKQRRGSQRHLLIQAVQLICPSLSQMLLAEPSTCGLLLQALDAILQADHTDTPEGITDAAASAVVVPNGPGDHTFWCTLAKLLKNELHCDWDIAATAAEASLRTTVNPTVALYCLKGECLVQAVRLAGADRRYLDVALQAFCSAAQLAAEMTDISGLSTAATYFWNYYKADAKDRMVLPLLERLYVYCANASVSTTPTISFALVRARLAHCLAVEALLLWDQAKVNAASQQLPVAAKITTKEAKGGRAKDPREAALVTALERLDAAISLLDAKRTLSDLELFFDTRVALLLALKAPLEYPRGDTLLWCVFAIRVCYHPQHQQSPTTAGKCKLPSLGDLAQTLKQIEIISKSTLRRLWMSLAVLAMQYNDTDLASRCADDFFVTVRLSKTLQPELHRLCAIAFVAQGRALQQEAADATVVAVRLQTLHQSLSRFTQAAYHGALGGERRLRDMATCYFWHVIACNMPDRGALLSALEHMVEMLTTIKLPAPLENGPAEPSRVRLVQVLVASYCDLAQWTQGLVVLDRVQNTLSRDERLVLQPYRAILTIKLGTAPAEAPCSFLRELSAAQQLEHWCLLARLLSDTDRALEALEQGLACAEPDVLLVVTALLARVECLCNAGRSVMVELQSLQSQLPRLLDTDDFVAAASIYVLCSLADPEQAPVVCAEALSMYQKKLDWLYRLWRQDSAPSAPFLVDIPTPLMTTLGQYQIENGRPLFPMAEQTVFYLLKVYDFWYDSGWVADLFPLLHLFRIVAALHHGPQAVLWNSLACFLAADLCYRLAEANVAAAFEKAAGDVADQLHFLFDKGVAWSASTADSAIRQAGVLLKMSYFLEAQQLMFHLRLAELPSGQRAQLELLEAKLNFLRGRTTDNLTPLLIPNNATTYQPRFLVELAQLSVESRPHVCACQTILSALQTASTDGSRLYNMSVRKARAMVQILCCRVEPTAENNALILSAAHELVSLGYMVEAAQAWQLLLIPLLQPPYDPAQLLEAQKQLAEIEICGTAALVAAEKRLTTSAHWQQPAVLAILEFRLLRARLELALQSEHGVSLRKKKLIDLQPAEEEKVVANFLAAIDEDSPEQRNWLHALARAGTQASIRLSSICNKADQCTKLHRKSSALLGKAIKCAWDMGGDDGLRIDAEVQLREVLERAFAAQDIPTISMAAEDMAGLLHGFQEEQCALHIALFQGSKAHLHLRRVYDEFCLQSPALLEKSLVLRLGPTPWSSPADRKARFLLQTLSPAWRRLQIPLPVSEWLQQLPNDALYFVLQRSSDGQHLWAATLSKNNCQVNRAKLPQGALETLIARLPPGSPEALASIVVDLEQLLASALALLPMDDEANLLHLFLIAEAVLLMLPIEALPAVRRPFRTVTRDFSLPLLIHRLASPDDKGSMSLGEPRAATGPKGKKIGTNGSGNDVDSSRVLFIGACPPLIPETAWRYPTDPVIFKRELLSASGLICMCKESWTEQFAPSHLGRLALSGCQAAILLDQSPNMVDPLRQQEGFMLLSLAGVRAIVSHQWPVEPMESIVCLKQLTNGQALALGSALRLRQCPGLRPSTKGTADSKTSKFHKSAPSPQCADLTNDENPLLQSSTVAYGMAPFVRFSQ